jgi:undecaprenol kinase
MGRFAARVRYAAQGIAYAFRTELHMRIHAAAAAIVVLLAAVLGVSAIEWAILIAMSAMVIAAELINTAVERAVDLATNETHALAKAAKDTAAGAVLAAAVAAAVVGAIILIPYLWRVLMHALD